jgi:hypothetical protein
VAYRHALEAPANAARASCTGSIITLYNGDSMQIMMIASARGVFRSGSPPTVCAPYRAIETPIIPSANDGGRGRDARNSLSAGAAIETNALASMPVVNPVAASEASRSRPVTRWRASLKKRYARYKVRMRIFDLGTGRSQAYASAILDPLRSHPRARAHIGHELPPARPYSIELAKPVKPEPRVAAEIPDDPRRRGGP